MGDVTKSPEFLAAARAVVDFAYAEVRRLERGGHADAASVWHKVLDMYELAAMGKAPFPGVQKGEP